MSLLKTAGIQHPSVATQSITINASTGEVTFPNNTIGDVTAVAAGTGISVASSAGPVPTVSIDTATTVDKTTAQTLTNKTLTTPIIASISNTGTLTLPTSTDTLVGRDTTDTLTNKTIAASSNTITGVINNTLTTTTGDLIYASGANTPARLAIGSTDQVLKVSGGVPVWGSAAGGAASMTWTAVNTGGTTLTGSVVSINVPAGTKEIVCVVEGDNASGLHQVGLGLNNSNAVNHFKSHANYYNTGTDQFEYETLFNSGMGGVSSARKGGSETIGAYGYFQSCDKSTPKTFNTYGTGGYLTFWMSGIYTGGVITSVEARSGYADFTGSAGKFFVYAGS